MSQTPELPTYEQLTATLNDTALKLHASQVHGLICGILAGPEHADNAWHELVTGGQSGQQTHGLLQALYDASYYQLKNFLLEFQLMLPNEQHSLVERSEALSLWCQGFLTGLKLVQIPITEREPGELTDAIDDLIEIAKLRYELVTDDDENEAAYQELMEYIRMAVIYIYQLQHENDPTAPLLPGTALH